MGDIQAGVRLPDGTQYRPGDMVRVEVRLNAVEDWEAKRVDVMAWWRTSGRGDEDKGIAASVALFERGARVPMAVRREVTLTLPLLPWTYRGHLIKIDWFVGVYATHGWTGEVSADQPVIVHPEPEGVAPYVEESADR